MAPDESDISALLDDHLSQGLSVLARAAQQVGACSVSVLVSLPGESIRLVYRWPLSPAPAGAEDQPAPERLVALEGLPVPPLTRAVVARLLGQTAASAHSFLFEAWPEGCWRVLIAFGYVSERPLVRTVPQEVSAALRLAALAAWAVPEARRLRRDLRAANESLRQRKMVERAKGLLQVRHGWNEQRAYEHLRKLSRQRRKTLAETAQELVRVSQQT